MLSYHNDPAVKEKFQLRFAAHRAADEVIQGTGFNNGRGCFVGCTLDTYNHSRFPEELGWPEWLAHLADAIFEGIPASEAPQFGTDLLEAVPIGVDLEKVQWMLVIDRHERLLELLKANKEDYAEQCKQAINGVTEYARSMLNNTATETERLEVAKAAAAAEAEAEAAAWAAEAAAAAWAAEAAAWAAAAAWAEAAAAAEAAWAAAEAAWAEAEAAWAEAEAAENPWKAERDSLLSILRNLQK